MPTCKVGVAQTKLGCGTNRFPLAFFLLFLCAVLLLATFLLWANYAALEDDCSHQSNVWAWTAIALPLFVLGIALLVSLKHSVCECHPPRPFPYVWHLYMCGVTLSFVRRDSSTLCV